MKNKFVKFTIIVFFLFGCSPGVVIQLIQLVSKEDPLKDVTLNYQPLALPFIVSMTSEGVTLRTAVSIQTPIGKFTNLIDILEVKTVADIQQQLSAYDFDVGEFKEDDVYVILRDDERQLDTIVHVENGKNALFALQRLDGFPVTYAHPGNRNVVYSPASPQVASLSYSPLFSTKGYPESSKSNTTEFETLLQGSVVIINVTSLETIEVAEQVQTLDECSQHTTNLQIGSKARLVGYHSTTLRSSPMVLRHPINNGVGYILENEIVDVTGKPSCDQLGYWWPVSKQNDPTATGWVREDDTYHRFFEPAN